jgi:hypothetical protein
MMNYGYYSDPSQTKPEFDPGIEVPCIICAKDLTADDIRTISLMAISDVEHDAEGLSFKRDNRSYFYRVHRSCHESLTEEQRTKVDGLLIDAIASTRNHN